MKMEKDHTLHILICGGRHFNDYELLKSTVSSYISAHGFEPQNIEIISGHCPGADMLGEQFAQEHNIKVKLFPAQWKQFGKAAGLIRNKQMVDYLNSLEHKAVIAFISPNSQGTRYTITLAKRMAIDVWVTEYVSDEKK